MVPKHSRIAKYLELAIFFCIYKSTIIFLPNRPNRFELLLVHVGCMYPVVEIYMFVDKDQYTKRSELSVGACYLLY